MIGTGWLTAGALVVGALCVALAAITAAQRVAQVIGARRTARLVAPVRPLVLRLAAGADEDGEAMARLRAVEGPTWAAIEPLIVRTLGKVRGDARSDLVTLLQSHGGGEHALTAAESARMADRATAAETLGVLGDPSYVPTLLRLLDDGARDVRQVAARALGAIGEPEAAGPLLGTLGGTDAVPAQTVAQALLRLGSAASPTLIAGLSSPSAAVRAVAIDVLGLHQATGAVKPLVAALTADPDTALRERAALALGRIGHPGALEPLVATLATDRPSALRTAAAAALGDLGSTAAVDALAPLLASPDSRVARAAATSLTRLGEPGLAALTAATIDDPPPDGTLVVIEPGRYSAGPASGLAGARAAAALATVTPDRGRVRA